MLFIILTFPGAIISGYFFIDLIQTDVGSMLLILFDDITFSYHALNFFMLIYTNRKFYAELKFVLKLAMKNLGFIDTVTRQNQSNTWFN